MGMKGSWSGPGGGGYREYYLFNMLKNDLGMSSFLLYGTGNTPTFRTLLEDGYDVTGCDISSYVIEYYRNLFGHDAFFSPEELPEKKKYDGIISVEVFEHFYEPKQNFEFLVRHLNNRGVICGTTNFYPGGPIEDGNKPGYMSTRLHVAYWSEKSLSFLSDNHGLSVASFKMVRPGSVLPDERYGQLFRNKRVFFIYNPDVHEKYFENLKKRFSILPIDRP